MTFYHLVRKILLYISAMLAFRQVAQQKSLEKEKVSERLGAVPGVTVESLITRFTETVRGSSRLVCTIDGRYKVLTFFQFAIHQRNEDESAYPHFCSMPKGR